MENEDDYGLRERGFWAVARAKAKRFGGWYLRGTPKLTAGVPHETDSSAPFRGLPHTTGSAGGC